MIFAIFKGFYPYFFIPALLIIILRLRSRQWTKGETIVLILLFGHAALTIFQVGCFGHEWNFSRRYLLPAAPLAFGWSAIFLLRILRIRWMKYVLPFFLIFLLFDAWRPTLKSFLNDKKRTERLAVEMLSPIIIQDYFGPRTYCPELWWDEYRSPFRPTVQSPFPALGYEAYGRSWNPESPERLVPDYIVCNDFTERPDYMEIHRTVINGHFFRILRRDHD